MKRAEFSVMAAGAVLLPRRQVAAQTLTPITFGTTPNESYGLGIFAQEAGFFRKHGLDVQMSYFTGGGALLAALVGGTLEYACVNWGAISNAHVKGVPVSAIAAGALYNTNAPTTLLCAAKNSTYATGKDLNGRTVSVTTLKDLQQAAVMKWVDTNGGDSSTVRFLELPLSEVPQALSAGRIDAALIPEPNLSMDRPEVRVLGKPYDAIAKHLMITAHVAMLEHLNQTAATGKRVAAALGEAAIWANSNHRQSAEILARVAKMPPEALAVMNRAEFARRLDPAAIQPVIDACVEYKFLATAFPVQDVFWPGLRT